MKRILVIVLLSLVTGIACAQDEARDKGVKYVKVDSSSNDAVIIVAKTPKVTESGGVNAAAMGSNASVGHGVPPLEAEEPAEPQADDPSR